jgi:hypothetical protein
LVPSVHVASAPLTHAVCPFAQLFEHVAEHAAVGASPEQLIGGVQAEVDVT